MSYRDVRNLGPRESGMSFDREVIGATGTVPVGNPLMAAGAGSFDHSDIFAGSVAQGETRVSMPQS